MIALLDPQAKVWQHSERLVGPNKQQGMFTGGSKQDRPNKQQGMFTGGSKQDRPNKQQGMFTCGSKPVSYTHLRAHETA